MNKLRATFSLIRFSHSVFALPFALAAMLVASQGLPSMKLAGLVVLCMVLARTAAMAFNRWTDAEMDQQNPRTKGREIPQGKLSKNYALGLTGVASGLFIGATFFINELCFFLSPLALFILLIYSYTKRFTALAHLFVGLALGISPVGAWMAVTGTLALAPIILGLAVLFWVAGFDLIYACQDFDFDKKTGLRSLVVTFGIKDALFLARVFHLYTMILFLSFGMLASLTIFYYGALAFVGIFLVYEHSIVSENDLSRVNAAFFTSNGLVSFVFLLGTALSLYFT